MYTEKSGNVAVRPRDAHRARVARCYFCTSSDTMRPFLRSTRVFLLSLLLPVRWRYCRSCGRHFIAAGRPAPGSY